MFNKILIANRGEIALRIIRACREMGIGSVVVYSQADANSLPVRFADEAICIGPPRSNDSYLTIPRIIGAAEITNADAIHPGYGFLAESAKFAEMCQDSDITFIGPHPETIIRMGDKALAKKTMKDSGVPILPGSDGALESEEQALVEAKRIGYPVILKASAGGGGKGMRVVNSKSSMSRSYNMAKVEAETAFANGELYIEKYLTSPRHIEVQIMGYQDGTVQSFGERDWSIQRRHQKLIEESPSPAVTPQFRKKLEEAAIKGARSVNYVGAGTIEFLVDRNDFHFMEMNTRIQVEHPVTEAVSGVDLVKEQIAAIAGEKPSRESVELSGHAIECRVNAEDSEHNFSPSPGKILTFHVPGGMGIRVDTHAFAGYMIPPYYDSMIAKLIAFGRDREEALARMNRALDEFVIEGISTTIPFHKRVMNNPIFQKGKCDTSFIAKHLKD